MIAAAANLAWLASQAGIATRFRRQLKAPQAAQEAVLSELLRRNAGSAFGRQHGFSNIRSPAEFAVRIPLSTYAELEPWVRRIVAGEQAVLTSDPVTHLVPTSGSSGARKLIPFTASLQQEFNRAIGPWITDLWQQHPTAMLGPSYWSISPVLATPAEENSAVPIGFEDDTQYLGGVHRRLVAATMAVPSALREVADMEAYFVLTLVCLLRRRDLRLISVWHPSFLLLLLGALARHWGTVLDIVRTGRLPADLPVSGSVASALKLSAQPGRARELDQSGPDQPHRLWPKLAVISCWTDAHAGLGAATLGRLFPSVALQPKGLLATEAFVTLPFASAHPLAVGSHYFEFLDETGGLHAAEALQAGRVYEVIVSTGGGLWRYRLGDRVRVEGFVARTPSLRFVGRAGNGSDLRGEKLTGEFVEAIIADLGRDMPVRFAMLAPDFKQDAGGYTLFWEGETPPSAADLDRRLAANPHYAWCRKLGQLRPARVFVIRSGADVAYFRRIQERGLKPGDIKPAPLSADTGWAECFAGQFRE
jgi:hypothetical protein